MHAMNKREFLMAASVVSTAALMLHPSAAQNVKVPRVGVIVNGGPRPFFEGVRQGLAELGYVEGQTITFEPRFLQGQAERAPGYAAELVRLNVDLIVAVGAIGTRAAQEHTTTIPIVFSAVLDPIAVGFTTSLERPSGNITGVTSFDPQQAAEQFELLKRLIPNLTRVAILSDQNIPRSESGTNPFEVAYETAAQRLGLRVQMLHLKALAPDLEGAFRAMIDEGIQAVVALEDPAPVRHQKGIAEMAALHRLPSMFPGGWRGADMGGLMTYGTSILDTLPRLASYVDKILKGAKPADLPIEVITRRELILNLKTARAIGVTIPPEVLKQADRVID